MPTRGARCLSIPNAATRRERRSGGVARLLLQAAFMAVACLSCAAMLLTMMNGQFKQRYVSTLKAELLQYAGMGADVIPAQAVVVNDGEARDYLAGFLEPLFAAVKLDSGAKFSYALYRFDEGEGMTALAQSGDVQGPSAAATRYRQAAKTAQGELWEDGFRLCAVCGVTDEAGETVGALELIGDWQPYEERNRGMIRQVLTACIAGVGCMTAVYLVMAFFSARREIAKGGGAD